MVFIFVLYLAVLAFHIWSILVALQNIRFPIQEFDHGKKKKKRVGQIEFNISRSVSNKFVTNMLSKSFKIKNKVLRRNLYCE